MLRMGVTWQVYGLIERGAQQRATGTTKLNELSSRSHAVFVIIIEKSTLSAPDAGGLGGELEQFRGLAPGQAPPSMRFPVQPSSTSPSTLAHALLTPSPCSSVLRRMARLVVGTLGLRVGVSALLRMREPAEE